MLCDSPACFWSAGTISSSVPRTSNPHSQRTTNAGRLPVPTQAGYFTSPPKGCLAEGRVFHLHTSEEFARQGGRASSRAPRDSDQSLMSSVRYGRTLAPHTLLSPPRAKDAFPNAPSNVIGCSNGSRYGKSEP